MRDLKRSLKSHEGAKRAVIPADGWYEWTGEQAPKDSLANQANQAHFCFLPRSMMFGPLLTEWNYHKLPL